MDGFLNLHKPSGLTSHDCVAKVRKVLRLKRVGHGGTLDPAATGVLPLAIGRATRLLQYLPPDKGYRGTVRFGVRTTTDDLEGEVISATPAPDLTLEQVKSHLPVFIGKIQQIPPSYSAIQVGGRRLYELARSGEAIEAPVRSVEIYGLQVLDWRPQPYPELDLAIECGAGTYIRSIARDLGDRLNTGGTLASLIRTCSSGFKLAGSLTLEVLAEQVQAGEFAPVSPELALAHLSAVTLPAPIAKRWGQGQRIAWDTPISSLVRVQHEEGQFLGIGQAIASDEAIWLVPKLVWG
ncbi:tRNA pseudouridine(55) synthase TruB [Phormidium tenue FACHB-886]|nr:tRNA pseudouridine(55) synthase TruB [Phormidium tenue FACHB-886]